MLDVAMGLGQENYNKNEQNYLKIQEKQISEKNRYFFLEIIESNTYAHNARIVSSMNTHMQTLPYEHIWRLAGVGSLVSL